METHPTNATDPTIVWSVWLQGSSQFWRAAPRSRCLLRRDGGLALSGEAELGMNWGVVGGGEESPLLLRDLVATLADARLPAYLFFAGEVAPRLHKSALELGLVNTGTASLMVRDSRVRDLPLTSLAVSRVRDLRQLRRVSTIAAAAFDVAPSATSHAFDQRWLELPDIDIFVGEDGGSAVSACVTTRTGRWTGIWAMSTRPEARRRGHCSALLAAVLEHHAPSTELFYLSSTAMSERIYERLGFRTVDVAEEWDFAPAEAITLG